MRILITGATGFVGRHVVKALQNYGYRLALFVRNIDGALKLKNLDTEFIKGDLGNLDAVKKSIREFEPEVCIHLAWEGIPDFSAEKLKLNLDNSINFLNFIIKKTDCKKLIVSGSCFEYGKTKGACKESDNVKTTSFFAWAKQSIYNYASLLCEQSAIDLIWFRIFYVYGPGQRAGSLIPAIINKFNKAERPDIMKPHNKNDFVYVEDVAKAFQIAATNKIPSGVYNLGSGISTSVYEVCKTAERLITGQTLMSEQLRKTNNEQEIVDFWANISKISHTLDWSASTSLEEGIKKYIQALRGNNI
ncbi:MAG: NAD(P)-dependent oxidoreductase [Proteobacteria bacterium]|nr:NAD(P)-dependent oxidoreductase [Pseudomonadota bacterium]MBU4258602.1 NAD(P)-dependent oxidoreductase [Pseudomonadota bacterium]MBU4287668.1 NAD(P)-dependent oxidoreductase [Pseudomonadota bacterium]MBU4413551.1 NAD(P)-dependent oxidoreductase [Pseudomonadota bacterium]MCG2759556.1 NAD(P)-dependent oxidoreductase [Desulfobacteraceae bacterium]